MKRLFKYLKPYSVLIVIDLALAGVSVFATLILPIFVGEAIDCMVDGEPQKRFVQLLFMMLAVTATGFISQYFMGVINTRIQTGVVRSLRHDAFATIVRLPVSAVDGNSHGDLASRIIADADAVGDGLLMGFSSLLTGVLTIAGTMIMLFRISARIAPVVVLLTPLSLFAARFISRKSSKYFNEQATIRGSLTEFSDERIHSSKLINAYGAGELTREAFYPLNDKLTEVSLKATFYSSLPNPSSRFINNLIYMAVGTLGALNCISGAITVGALTGFLAYAGNYAKPFNEITGVITEFQNAIVCARRIFELTDMEVEGQSDRIAAASAEHSAAGNDAVLGDVEFKDVAFSYDRKKELIKDLNISVEKGEHVAIVGPTGAGKTTLVNLLMRFYDTDAGEIDVDGVNIDTMDRNALRRSYGMVLQETWIRKGTILYNITLGDENVTFEEVVAAAKRTRAHDFIRKLPHQYYTVVSGEDGVISRGQKQLICITRVMLKLPPMLILDEATSSIDTRTEMKIQDAFKRMMQKRTTFIVAHRLSTIRHSDLILYMEGGKVLEHGTHEELLTENGRYARLYNIK